MSEQECVLHVEMRNGELELVDDRGFCVSKVMEVEVEYDKDKHLYYVTARLIAPANGLSAPG